MKLFLVTLVVFLAGCFGSNLTDSALYADVSDARQAEKSLIVDAAFPGGNISVKSSESNVYKLEQELRGSPSHCFYWAFRVKNVTKPQTVTFSFSGQTVVSCWGPAVSRDGGKTWSWLYSDKHYKSDRFSYSFKAGENNLIFADAPMYVQADFDRFFNTFAGTDKIQRDVLCKSRKDRDVELYRFGLNQNSPNTIVFTARHHARETAASYVLEGTIQEILSGSAEGNYLLANAAFYVIPFVDKDGVEDGDPGKNRAPHDHNRDYGEKIYPSVQAITSKVPQWSQGSKLVLIDYHCPGLHTNQFYFTNYKPSYMLDQLNRLAAHLVERHQGNGIPFTSQTKPSGSLNPAMSRAWFSSQPNAILAVTLEVPFATAKGVMVTPENLRQLGHDLAKALADFIRDE
ncbi:MAG: M14 family zinc carboxypeptidase, partial [Planctomycetia bacterium]|nr:M14 family zinc carboxypeptidase [Planctomycetia bacterium]